MAEASPVYITGQQNKVEEAQEHLYIFFFLHATQSYGLL